MNSADSKYYITHCIRPPNLLQPKIDYLLPYQKMKLIQMMFQNFSTNRKPRHLRPHEMDALHPCVLNETFEAVARQRQLTQSRGCQNML